MRFRKISNWDEQAKTPGLLYFAQSLEEMLFDFSLDTYKASVMHAGLLASEALRTVAEVEAGTIREPNVRHVTAELALSLQTDPVSIALMPLPYSSFAGTLRDPKVPLRDLSTALQLIVNHLAPAKYRSKTEELLIAAITNAKPISEIRRLTRSYVTALLASGMPTRFLYDQTKQFFHYGATRVTGPEALTAFFGLFPTETHEFSAVFRVDDEFEHMSSAFEHLKVKIVRRMPPELNLDGFPAFYRAEKPWFYAIVTSVKAWDAHSARASAEKVLRFCATLLNLFHHKRQPTWSRDCVVYDISKHEYRMVAPPTNPMHKCADLLPPIASRRLQLFMNEFSLERISFAKFVRSAQLHALALSSNSDENQIINLWIALESLAPSESKPDDVSNIEHIVASLLPFLNYGYIERLVDRLAKDLLTWNTVQTKRALKAIPGKKIADKLVRLLALKDFGDQRVALEGAFKDFHLLRDRFEYFKSMLTEPSNVKAALDAHSQRVEWQLRRIYRTRNIIVHSGRTPGYTKALIEHTHNYLDTVLNMLVKLASTPKAINSVAQGFKYAQLKYSRYESMLGSKGARFDNANIEELLFCR